MAGTLDERLAQARHTLVAAGIKPDDAALDADVLARHVLGWTRASLLVYGRDPVPSGFEERFAAALDRRAAREPVAYITGVREFWTRDFEVDRNVLIPRPETELIVEAVIERDQDRPRILDVGTGSGCLAVTFAAELPHAQVVATDVSIAAIAVARRNAERHGVSARVLFVLTNLLDGLPGSFNIIVSNPPYIARASELPPDVIQYEPHGALYGGEDGLEAIRVLIRGARAHLADGGLFVVEFGFGQAEQVRELAGNAGWKHIEIRKDLQGIERTAVLS
jgi:release factor glutamine methyltransferase